MSRLLILLILFGSQIGLSDFLVLPVYTARYGELSFFLLYAFFKLVIVLPLLHAELVAGRLHRVSPFELAAESRYRFVVWLPLALCLAVLFVVASGLHNASWTLAIGSDALTGDLSGFGALDRALYWYELGTNNTRLIQLMIIQVVLLAAVAWFAWHGIALVYALVLPVCLVLVVQQIPAMGALLEQWQWRPVSVEGILQALQYALTSSIAGFMAWYLVGARLPQSLPTGRWVLAVQLFDLLLGLSILAVVYPRLGTVGDVGMNASVVLQALVEQLSLAGGLTPALGVFMLLAAGIGTLGSLPLLLLISLAETGRTRRGWLLATLAAALFLAMVLLVSAQAAPALTWYGMPLSEAFNWFSFNLIVPLMALITALWVGWGLAPNQVLKQVNPKTGSRYLAWRMAVKFVVPLAVALIFARATLGFSGATLSEVLGLAVIALVAWRMLNWLRREAIYPLK